MTDKQAVREHWTNWAKAHGADIKATTRTWTAKALEIDALARRLEAVLPNSSAHLLEVGCGNGVNCVELAKRFPAGRFDGVDYIPDMVASAMGTCSAAGLQGRVRFFEGDVLKLDATPQLARHYDVVFTDRCLINLASLDVQKEGISALSARVRPGGYLLMIENSLETFGNQNRCRNLLGLPSREPAAFNVFFDEPAIRRHIANLGCELMEVEDFSGLHDLMLYVLVPAINGGTVDYQHPLVEAATALSKGVAADAKNAFGPWGQNRLFVCRKPL